jgi:hypothetical protein
MKPIMMSTEDVQAVLEGRKTMMRRVVKEDRRGEWAAVNGVRNNSEYGASVPCYLHRETAVDDISRNIMYPNNDAGDILWVRETWSPVQVLPKRYLYKADAENGGEGDGLPIRWRPSIHMPREAARIFLRVTDVRVERLLDITETDAMREGFEVKIKSKTVNGNVYNGSTTAREGFLLYWDDLYAYKDVPKGEIFGPKASHKNPWVWVYAFRRITREEACDE